MFKVVKIMFVLCLWIVWSVALDDHFRIVDDPQSSNLFEFNGDRFQDSVQNSTGPIFLWSVLGLPKSGKSAFANALVHVSRFLNNAQGESSAEDAFDASGWWSQRESMIAAPVPRSDGGIDLFLDMEGSRFGSYSEQTWKLPLIAACASSSPIIFLTNEFNDQTFHMISSLSVRLKYGIGTECSFREGGPSMVVIINSHDAALRQEQEPGGLEAVWQKIAESVPEEAQDIHQTFSNIRFVALPYVRNEGELRNLNSPYGQKVLALHALLQADAKPVTLLSEDDPTCSSAGVSDTDGGTCPNPAGETPLRYEGTPATIAAALSVLVDNANRLADRPDGGPFPSPRIRDLVHADAQRASAACLQTFSDSIAQWSQPSCHEQCSGDAGGCEVVQLWVQPARSAAEACFAERTAKWRGSSRDSGKVEDPFGPSVLDPALQQLRRDVQGKADALRGAWQYANSVDPAKTVTETRITELDAKDVVVSPRRYGGRCFGIIGGRQFLDYAKVVEHNWKAETVQFKRCGAMMPKLVVDMGTHEKEVKRWTVDMCAMLW